MEPTSPQAPQSPQTNLDQPPTDSVTKKKLIIQAIALILSPVVLIVAALVLYAVVNFLFATMGVSDDNVLRRVLNIVLFLLGAIGSLMFIIGPILGIIRLVKALR